MRPTRPVLDVSRLPTVVFGHRSAEWWGTLGFMVIEGTTLALVAAAYLYVRKNHLAWPPERTPFPHLGVAIAQLIVMGVSCIPAYLAKRRAHALDVKSTAVWLWVSAFLGLVILTLRWFELQALTVRWDTHAYGSVAWAVLGFHGSLLVLDVLDTLGLAYVLSTGRAQPKHFPAVSDNSDYWFFIMAAWIPLFVLVFLSPRWI
ncbi:MAG: cytochrome C oxidase subunit III [Gemmatimonadota bacterium]|nr:cytochrome C oxidase subunit III [Gemmatimonadota bacterium]